MKKIYCDNVNFLCHSSNSNFYNLYKNKQNINLNFKKPCYNLNELNSFNKQSYYFMFS